MAAAKKSADKSTEAIPRRLEELLAQQRDRLHDYLAVLEKHQTAIESGREDHILTYVEIEESLASEIFSIQKVIEPLEAMSPVVVSISALRAELEGLKNMAAAQSRRNGELLFTRMAALRAEISALKSSQLAMGGRRSLYQGAGTASFIDIEG